MESLTLAESDIIHHFVKCGIDIYPLVEIPLERTRLNIFYEEARTRHPELCEQLVASDREFRISKEFQSPATPAAPRLRVDTFAITHRGPVFTIPLRLPNPVGPTALEDRMFESFNAMRKLFFASLAERKIMRVGIVRDLLFDTGQSSCERLLSDRRTFAGAELKGGKSVLLYRDERCNLRLEFEPAEVMKSTRLPVGGEVTERQSFGLHVVLDVNNHQPKPLEEDDIEQVIARASSLWPDELLKCF